ncbi:MAG: hypothetical protein HS116_25150 [Planctomycetes bacterium]|nr:hypothetical protein [Planctomycetota bacterium]
MKTFPKIPPERSRPVRQVDPIVEARGLPTPAQVATAARAMITGTLVSEEVMLERTAICNQCPLLRQDSDGAHYCGACGCNIKREVKRGLNMAAYEENLPHWGCKFPGRAAGKGGWKR